MARVASKLSFTRATAVTDVIPRGEWVQIQAVSGIRLCERDITFLATVTALYVMRRNAEFAASATIEFRQAISLLNDAVARVDVISFSSDVFDTTESAWWIALPNEVHEPLSRLSPLQKALFQFYPLLVRAIERSPANELLHLQRCVLKAVQYFPGGDIVRLQRLSKKPFRWPVCGAKPAANVARPCIDELKDCLFNDHAFAGASLYRDGEAWKAWVTWISQFLKMRGVRPTARNDYITDVHDGGSKFVRFVSELQSTLPAEYRKHGQSRHGLAKAINRARARHTQPSSVNDSIRYWLGNGFGRSIEDMLLVSSVMETQRN